MADRIAIMGGEPYEEWIKRDDKAQRLFKAYRDKWPDSDAQCVAIGREFYVRFNNGDGMRRVYNVDDFDNEDEWCAQCGTPIDPDGGETAMRVVANIVRSRVARASHGRPTVEPLNRTALRLYKRAGRPELNERYARIRKNIAATRGND